MNDEGDFVIPSEISWEHYIGQPLEELLYWLCDALGAKELQWRAGSVSGTSRDRGRDLEATFHIPMIDGDLEAQRWWVQAKGRSNTVPPQTVREAIVDVQAYVEVDVLVIATNSRFSNDTRDWVAEFQATHPRPVIRLWDSDALERMVVKHPSVVARVAPAALSLAGRLEVAASTFWDRQQLPTQGQLDGFWGEREDLRFSPNALVALVVGDAAAGRLVHHPWGAEAEEELLLGALVLALINVGQLFIRMERVGHNQEPLAAGVAHLVGCALVRISADVVVKFVSDPWSYAVDGPELQKEDREMLRHLLCGPVVARLFEYFGAACMEDCERMFDELGPDGPLKPEHRFLELLPTSVPRDDITLDPRTLLIQKLDAPCRAGLELSDEHGCPFGAVDDRPWEELFVELQTVLVFRLNKAIAHRAGPSTATVRRQSPPAEAV
jgi:hypothetical protein